MNKSPSLHPLLKHQTVSSEFDVDSARTRSVGCQSKRISCERLVVKSCSQSIFSAAGLDDPILTLVILGAVNMASTFLGIFLVEKVGRRVPLFVGAIWQATWLLVFALVGTAQNPSVYPNSGQVMIVAACMFIASFSRQFV